MPVTMPVMTVHELIQELSKLDPKLRVVNEGCDCWADVVGVELVSPDSSQGLVGRSCDSVLLKRRSDETHPPTLMTEFQINRLALLEQLDKKPE